VVKRVKDAISGVGIPVLQAIIGAQHAACIDRAGQPNRRVSPGWGEETWVLQPEKAISESAAGAVHLLS
jgi:hypothetical protein